MRYLLPIVLIFMWGCADTRGVNKELPMRIEQGGDGNTISMNIQLELQSDTLGESGEARISPQTSASVYGPSQASGAEALMDDLKYVIEKWMDNRSEETTVIEPEPKKEPVEEPIVEEPIEPVLPDGGINMTGWEVLDYFPCDQTMTFRDEEETAAGQGGTPQMKCLFTSYDDCEELPDSFMIVWKEGEQLEQLMVPRKCSMTWVKAGKDYRKYRPMDDHEPHPVAYAARGTTPETVYLMVKKTNASSTKPGWKHKKTVVWDGNPNPDHANRVFSRCWWTETSGSASQLQRKFNFTDKKPSGPVLVVFEGGPEVKVTDVGKRHYPGAAGDVKWGVPKLDDGNPCKHFYSIAAPKGSNPAWATMHYN